MTVCFEYDVCAAVSEPRRGNAHFGQGMTVPNGHSDVLLQDVFEREARHRLPELLAVLHRKRYAGGNWSLYQLGCMRAGFTVAGQ